MGEETEQFKKINASQGSGWDRLVFWKMAFAKLTCLCLLAAGGSITATLNGAEWDVFTPTQKFLAIVAAIMSVVSVILAFLSDTMAKLTDQAEVERKSQAVINETAPPPADK